MWPENNPRVGSRPRNLLPGTTPGTNCLIRESLGRGAWDEARARGGDPGKLCEWGAQRESSRDGHVNDEPATAEGH